MNREDWIYTGKAIALVIAVAALTFAIVLFLA